MRRTIFLATAAILGLAICQRAVADNATAKKIFKEAFFQQTVEDDVAQAIELYQKGLKEPDVSARLASTAWFQLGICYEKQGKQNEALKCYQKVIAQYPDETKNVAKAKKKYKSLTTEKPKVGYYIAYLDNLPVDRLDLQDKKVTRSYIKEKFGPILNEHPQGFFLNYSANYGLRFDMIGDRVREICLFQSFPGKVYLIDEKGKETLVPDLQADLVSNKIELRKSKGKKYIAYLENLPVDRLDLHDKEVTRKYLKEKFGSILYEHPKGFFLNYGAKYGLRFDMDGEHVREICLFQSFPGEVYQVDTEGKKTLLSPLKTDLISSEIELCKAEGKKYVVYLENLPVDRLDIQDKKVTRTYLKKKLGPPQFEHPSGSFLNYGAKHGLRFDMKGDRVQEIFLFKSFSGDIYTVDSQGKESRLPPLQTDLISGQIELRKAKPKSYVAYIENLPIEQLDIHDKKVTRSYLKEELGAPQYETPDGSFLNYGLKYGLRFDMVGERVQNVYFFKEFPGEVFVVGSQSKTKVSVPSKGLTCSKIVLTSSEVDSKDKAE